MNESRKVGYFSPSEQWLDEQCRRFRDPVVGIIVRFLARRGVTPDAMSYLGVLMILPFLYFFTFNPWLAFLFLLLNLIFDGLDGPLARHTHTSSDKGEFTDKASDTLSFALVFLTFLYFGLLNPFWSAVLILNAAAMQSLVIFGQMRKVPLFPILRPKVVIYFFFLVWLMTGENYFDPVILALAVYYIVTNLFLFSRIRCSLS